MSLGECVRCHGRLCVSGRSVACESCGTPQEGHPLIPAGWAEARESPDAFEASPVDFPATVPERVARLEAAARGQDGRIAALEAALAELGVQAPAEGTPPAAEGTGKRRK